MIAFDKSHIGKRPGEAVDRVRQRKNIKMLNVAGDDRLTVPRYDWMRHQAATAESGL
jgi:hypothetical protein